MSTGFWMAFSLGAGAGCFGTAVVMGLYIKLRRAAQAFERRL